MIAANDARASAVEVHADRGAAAAVRTASTRVRERREHSDLFRHLGVEFISLREQIDTGSPLGQAVFTIIAAIAQLERSLIPERVRAGLRRARADGKRLGRPPLQVDLGRVESVMRRKLSVRSAAKELGISPSSYLRLLRAQRADSGTLQAAAG